MTDIFPVIRRRNSKWSIIVANCRAFDAYAAPVCVPIPITQINLSNWLTHDSGFPLSLLLL